MAVTTESTTEHLRMVKPEWQIASEWGPKNDREAEGIEEVKAQVAVFAS